MKASQRMTRRNENPSDQKRSSVDAYVRVEAQALDRLATRLATSMRPQVESTLALMEACVSAGHRIVVTGIGKSGIIARKIVATMLSTGTPACYLHPAEAMHGDLGVLVRGDIALALSYSGETEEVLRLFPAFSQRNVPVISLCGCSTSTLATLSMLTLDVSVDEEACSLNLAPTASTTSMLALGDALAMELSHRRGFRAEHFAELHPGGRLGLRLARVRDLMHQGDDLPRVRPDTPMAEVIYEMSRKKLGMTTVLNLDLKAGEPLLAGIISDGDLRRLMECDGSKALEHTAGEVMNRTPHTIRPDAFASEALAEMEEKKITSLVVVEDGPSGGEVRGVVHLHDLWREQPAGLQAITPA